MNTARAGRMATKIMAELTTMARTMRLYADTDENRGLSGRVYLRLAFIDTSNSNTFPVAEDSVGVAQLLEGIGAADTHIAIPIKDFDCGNEDCVPAAICKQFNDLLRQLEFSFLIDRYILINDLMEYDDDEDVYACELCVNIVCGTYEIALEDGIRLQDLFSDKVLQGFLQT